MQGQTRIEFIFGVIIFAIIILYVISQVNTTFSSIISDYEIDSLKAEANSLITTLVGIGDIEKFYEEPISVDVMFVNDISGSMDDDCSGCDWVTCICSSPTCGICDARNASKIFVDELDPLNDTSGLVAFNESAYLYQSLTNETQDVKDAIDRMRAAGNTAIGDGIGNATEELNNNGRIYAEWFQILLTDGEHNTGQYPEGAAQVALNSNITIYTVGLCLPSNLNETLLRLIADMTGGRYYHAPDSTKLEDIYEEIATEIKSDILRAGTIVKYPYNISEGKLDNLKQNCDDLNTYFVSRAYRLKIYNSTDLMLFCGTNTIKPPRVFVSKYVLIKNELGNVSMEIW